MTEYAKQWAESVADAKLVMATEAHHRLGDISRDEPDYAWVRSEDDENYYGEWVTGFGFINVRFPKAAARDLTGDERQWLIEHPVTF